MKRLILFVVITTALAGTIISCGKTTKGKMDGKWKLDSSKTTTSQTSDSSTSSSTLNIDGSEFTLSNTDINGNTTAQSGSVQTATWNINKDGTWERELAVTFIESGTTTNNTVKTSGSWGFEGKNGDFKKNERVVFSTLSESNLQVNTTANVPTTSTSSKTYLEGENIEIFVITESKQKSLSMEVKKSSTSTATDGKTSTDTAESTFKLSL